MTLIYKYELNDSFSQVINMPREAVILDIQIQNGIPVAWAKVPSFQNEYISVRIDKVGTSFDFDEENMEYNYISTIQDGELVWHYFMVSEV